jgi:signal transduction histidine kinase
MTASYLAALNAGEQVSMAADRLIRSGSSMRALLDDLVDFNRTNLALGVKIVPFDIDLTEVVADELEQLRGAHPDRRIELETTGDVSGRWDGFRLQQLLRNLVSNAIRYGDSDAPVRVALRGEETGIRLEVTNQGPTLDPPALEQIFDPLKRAASQDDSDVAPDGLGLGLFIVREITLAHGGRIDVRSNRGETTFVIRLPRQNSREAVRASRVPSAEFAEHAV